MTALSVSNENTEEFRDDTTTSVSKSICSYSLLRYNYTSIYTTFRELRYECHPRPPGRRVSCRPDCAGAAGLGVQPSENDPPRARAAAQAELADRLPHQPDPELRRLRDLRAGLRQRHRAARGGRRHSGAAQRMSPPWHASARGRRQVSRTHHLPVPRLELPLRRIAPRDSGEGELSGSQP